MATQQTQVLGRALLTPAVVLLFVWMIVPLAMTIYFSTLHYSLLDPDSESFVGLENYRYFLTDPAFLARCRTRWCWSARCSPSPSCSVRRSPSARPARGRAQHCPVDGDRAVFRDADGERAGLEKPADASGLRTVCLDSNRVRSDTDRLVHRCPLLAVILIVAWQWLPFATLILLTALQSQDEEQKEAAEMDGAGALSKFTYLTLPHLARPITVVILIETIFLLTVFAEIFVTTGGGPGMQTTNIAFLIYSQALIQFDVGNASAGGLVAVVIANIVAFFLVRIIGRNLEA